MARLIGEDNNVLIVRYERTLQEGRGDSVVDTSSCSQSRYLGSPDKLFVRYRQSHAQDINYSFTTMRLSTRYAIFDTDSYDSRQDV